MRGACLSEAPQGQSLSPPGFPCPAPDLGMKVGVAPPLNAWHGAGAPPAGCLGTVLQEPLLRHGGHPALGHHPAPGLLEPGIRDTVMPGFSGPSRSPLRPLRQGPGHTSCEEPARRVPQASSCVSLLFGLHTKLPSFLAFVLVLWHPQTQSILKTMFIGGNTRELVSGCSHSWSCIVT